MAEIELKLSITRSDLAKILRLPRFKFEQPPVQARLDTTYFDTVDATLARQGMALRIRRLPEHWVQTLKIQKEALAGLQHVDELNSSLIQPKIDWAALSHIIALQHLPRENICPLFKTVFNRTAGIIQEGDARIELALDEGQVEAHHLTQSFCELELELLEGPPIELFNGALKLLEDIPCQLSLLSKADRGYLMLGKLDLNSLSDVSAGNPLTQWRFEDRRVRYGKKGSLTQLTTALNNVFSLMKEDAETSLNVLDSLNLLIEKLNTASSYEATQDLLQSVLYTKTWLLCHRHYC